MGIETIPCVINKHMQKLKELTDKSEIGSYEAMKPWFDKVDSAWENFIISVKNGDFGPNITIDTVNKLLNENK